MVPPCLVAMRGRRGVGANEVACMYNIENKEAFEEAFNNMRNKVDKKKISCLDSIYKFKEKRAECYMRDTFTLNEKYAIK